MNIRFLPLLLAIAVLSAFAPNPATGAPARWQAGAARIDITPEYPIRLSGYGSRKTEHEGIEQRIFAKALALGDGAHPPAVLVTVDNCGVPAHMRDELARRLAAKAGVPDERVAVCSSHTHCAPMLAGVLSGLFGADIPEDQMERIDRYTRELTDNLEKVALAALAARQPCDLAWASGEVAFAMNRRKPAPAGFTNSPNPGGPVDHALPVLRVTGAEGKVIAVFAGYACHCTTVAFNRIHGDWAGCAQEEIERQFPGAVALIAPGCAGDQNPNPRGTYDLVKQHGGALATEAARVVKSAMQPLAPALACGRKHLKLPFATIPTRAEFETLAAGRTAAIAYHARRNLARLDRGGKIPAELDYSVQTWSFGSDLGMVFLPGEVVVDYSLRIKRDLDGKRLWVNAYSNDVPCYIPSRRVLEEGGYEGGGAMIYYDRPTKFAPQVEELIIGAVSDLLPGEFHRGAK